jgi:hypothetical protein
LVGQALFPVLALVNFPVYPASATTTQAEPAVSNESVDGVTVIAAESGAIIAGMFPTPRGASENAPPAHAPSRATDIAQMSQAFIVMGI